MSSTFILFTYFIIFICGIVIGLGVAGTFYLRAWLNNKLSNLTVEVVDRDDE